MRKIKIIFLYFVIQLAFLPKSDCKPATNILQNDAEVSPSRETRRAHFILRPSLSSLSSLNKQAFFSNQGQTSRLIRQSPTVAKKKSHPFEMANLTQGDIMGVMGKMMMMPTGRQMFVVNTWPKGVVPFTLSPSFTTTERRRILQAMDQYHRNTCVRFVARTDQISYLKIEADNTGCWSLVGQEESEPQQLNLQRNGCLSLATIIHELMHAIGFYHEQARPDRDRFVTIHRQNIEPGLEPQFGRLSRSNFDDLGVRYDTGSVMQYDETSFSKNGRPTMTARDGSRLGNERGFSESDIREINLLYKCPETTTQLPTPTPTAAATTTARTTTSLSIINRLFSNFIK